LAEMIGALTENAVKWAHGEVRISAARTPSGTLRIDIADDGPGIAKADRARLMTRGARLDETTPGHGLGLAIAADRMQAYGGTIALEVADSGGLLARVTLPARHDFSASDNRI